MMQVGVDRDEEVLALYKQSACQMEFVVTRHAIGCMPLKRGREGSAPRAACGRATCHAPAGAAVANRRQKFARYVDHPVLEGLLLSPIGDDDPCWRAQCARGTAAPEWRPEPERRPRPVRQARGARITARPRARQPDLPSLNIAGSRR